MPGEFEEHSGCWMLWPERPDNWRLDAIPAQQTFSAVARAIAHFEPVSVGVSGAQFLQARRMLPDIIRVLEIPSNDAWMRDCGPTFVVNDQGCVRGIDWIFNAWGGLTNGLYFPWDLDNLVAEKVINLENLDRYIAPLVLEGGSIHTDGEGTLLTTEECLLNGGRNPHLSKGEIELLLKDYLNVEKIIWLKNGVVNDETHGHIDNLCCFIRPGVVALSWTDDVDDPQHAISQDAVSQLSETTDAKGRKLEIHTIHQPGPLYISHEESAGVEVVAGTKPRQGGHRLAPADRSNLYIANSGVVAPIFGDVHDRVALETLQKLFPDRKVVGIPAREILLGGGNIHCITQRSLQVRKHFIDRKIYPINMK